MDEFITTFDNQLNLFSFEDYYKKIDDKVIEIFNNDQLNKECTLHDILLNEYITKNNEIIQKAYKLKLVQMKIGLIWQFIIGNYKDFIDLKIGHASGLDIISQSRKIAIELKNRYNSDNASSRLSNYNKLAKFKKINPDYQCIYGIINDKKKSGIQKIIKHNNVEIIYCSSEKLLDLIFGLEKNKIITQIKIIINNHL